jgi:TPR repeat protein
MADLRSLVLLRNDPEAATRFLAQAEQGDVDAQYAIGLIYAEGRGIAQDEASAFYWLSRAVEQGDRDADLLRQVLSATMTDAQFDVADHMMHVFKAGQ